MTTLHSFGTAGDAQLLEPVYAAHWLVEADFEAPIGTQRFCTLPMNVSVGGNTYVGVGGNLEVGVVSESEDASAQRFSVSLAITDAAMLAATLGNVDKYRGKPLRLYLQLFTAELVPVGNRVLRRMGYMEPVRVRRRPVGAGGSSGRIELQCSPAGLARSRNARGLRLTHAQQQLRYPGDRGLEYLQGLINNPVTWLSRRFQEQ